MSETTIHKSLTTLVILIGGLLAASLPPSLAAEPPSPSTAEPRPAADALEKFRNLAGDWRGTNSDGDTVRLSYELVGHGSAVLERLYVVDDEGGHDMATLYYLDGDALTLTHYCVAGNQPRMRAVAGAASEIRFELVDVTGLASPEAGHMRRARFEFPSEDRLRSAWTWHENGQDAFTAVVEAERVAAERLASN